MAFAQRATRLAVAAPFLLLASCRGLHVMEDGQWPRKELILGAHHKTGTVLLEKAATCFDSSPSFKYTLDPHWQGDPIRPKARAVHLSRDPVSLTISAYLYHMETGEDWTLKPGEGMEILAKDHFLERYMGKRRESYTEFLRRVPTHVGLRAEMVRLKHEYDEVEVAEKFCGASKRCMEMCLEDFTASSSSYDASWRKALGLVGERVTPEMQQCLSKEDLHRNPPGTINKNSDHVTANTVSEAKYNELWSMVVDMDARIFDSRLKKMGEGRRGCGASRFIQNQAGSNATDGAGYAGWLIEEQYS